MKDNLIKFVDSHSELIINLAYDLLLAVAVLLACKILSGFSRRAILRINERAEQFDATFVPILCSTAKYLIYAIGTVIVLDIFGVNTSSIIALMGAVGLAVGFALKDTLSNIAAGIMLLILRPFRVDDSVEYGAISGKVKEINLFTTILESPDGLFISSPNGAIWGNSIKNFTRNDKRRLDVVVGVGYSDSIDKGFETLKKIVSEETRFFADPAPQIMVISMGDSAVNLQVRGWVLPTDYWQALWDLNKKIKEEIEAAGLSIPFPQRDLHIIDSRPS